MYKMAGETTIDSRVPKWNGEVSTLDAFEERVKYWVLGTQKDDRIHLGARLIAAMDEDSQQWQEAKKIALADLIKENGAENVVMQLKQIRGTMSTHEAISKWREFMKGIFRQPGEGPKKWVSRFDIARRHVGKALDAVCKDIDPETFIHPFLLGLIFLEGTHLDPPENAALLATCGIDSNSYLCEDTARALAAQWTEETLAQRDKLKG